MTRKQFILLFFAPFFGLFLPKPKKKPKKLVKTFQDKNGNLPVGYTGTTVLDAGFFYCPYIPLQYIQTGTMTQL